MATLVDTSVLVRWADKTDPDNSLASRALIELGRRGEDLVIARQNIYEYWAVATRPIVARGLGFTTADVKQDIERFNAIYTLLDDPPPLFKTWLDLVSSAQVIGKPSHDARLVALMVCLSIKTVLTFNVDDFKRFQQISPLHPNAV